MLNKIERIKTEAEEIQRKKLEETEATKKRIAEAHQRATDAEEALTEALTEEEYTKAEEALTEASRQVTINMQLLNRQKSAFDIPEDKYKEYTEELLKHHAKSKAEAQKKMRTLAIDLYGVIEAYATESEELLSVLKILDQAAGRADNSAAGILHCYLEELRKDADGASSSIFENAIRFYNSHPIPERLTPAPTIKREPAMRRFIKNGEVTLISEKEYMQEFSKKSIEATRKERPQYILMSRED